MALIQSGIKKILIFFEMIKIQHSVFALPFAYLGLFLAERGWPRWELFGWVTLAMICFRTMAMALNRLIDLPIDRHNPRTAGRALPARTLSVSSVWLVTFLAFAFFELSAFQLGPLCFLLSPIPVLLAFLYPWTKRFTWFSHAVLGMILGIAPSGAWIASRGDFSWIPGLLSIGVAAWVAGFDIIYALQDERFDCEYGLYSLPARFGFQKSMVITRWLHGIALLAWFSAGWFAGLGPIYIGGIAIVSFFLFREHWLIRSYGLRKLEEAFFTLNAMVSLAVMIAAIADFSLNGPGL